LLSLSSRTSCYSLQDTRAQIEVERGVHLQRILNLQGQNDAYQQHVANGNAERLALIEHVAEM
jgi:hypothetical protein